MCHNGWPIFWYNTHAFCWWIRQRPSVIDNLNQRWNRRQVVGKNCCYMYPLMYFWAQSYVLAHSSSNIGEIRQTSWMAFCLHCGKKQDIEHISWHCFFVRSLWKAIFHCFSSLCFCPLHWRAILVGNPDLFLLLLQPVLSVVRLMALSFWLNPPWR